MSITDRIIAYDSGAEWRADAQYGSPLYAVSATTTAAILGVGTSTLPGPWAVYQRANEWDGDRAGEAWAVDEDAGDIDDGITWEPFILGWAAKRWGYNLMSVAGDQPFRIHAPGREWLRVSPDALGEDATGSPGILDSKAVYGFGEWGDDGSEVRSASAAALDLFPPDRGPKYMAQAYTSLIAIPEAEWFDFIICLHPRDTRRIRVWRDEPYQAHILGLIESFRANCLVGGKEPPYDASVECVNHVERIDRDDKREATEEERGLLRRYAAATAAGKEAEEERKRVRVALALSMDKIKTLAADTGDGKPATYTLGSRGATARRLEML